MEGPEEHPCLEVCESKTMGGAWVVRLPYQGGRLAMFTALSKEPAGFGKMVDGLKDFRHEKEEFKVRNLFD